MEWGILATALAAGVLIGCVGIGGVLLVPALFHLVGVPILDAIAAAMFSYLFSGAAATWIYARKGSIDWTASGWLAAGAVPAAFAGSFAALRVEPSILEFLIAALVLLAGIRAFQPAVLPVRAVSLRGAAMAGLGAFVGFASAMTGTGGPLLLVPILVWLRVPILTTVGLGQAIQLPIATLATAGNLISDQLDFELGALLSVGVLSGSVLGARFAHIIPTVVLTRIVGALMLAVAILMIIRLLAP